MSYWRPLGSVPQGCPSEREWAADVGPELVSSRGPALCCLRSGFTGRTTGDAEPGVFQYRVRCAAPADRGAAAPLPIGPAPAAKTSIVAVPGWIGVVPAPFPDVADHVEETEGIRCFAGYVLGPAT